MSSLRARRSGSHGGEAETVEPASSSSQVPRPELRQALEDMAGVLNHWRSDRQEANEDTTAAPPAALPTVPLPLHFAVKSGNYQTLETLLKSSPPTEAALQELVKLPTTERQPLEELISRHLSRMNQAAMPLFACINFGMDVQAVTYLNPIRSDMFT
eukprot:symbB.v1.2.015644.t1/scaffold1142.1/size245703/13